MRNLFGWSIVAALLLSGVAGAQQVRPGTAPQPTRPGQPAAGQPGVGQPGAGQPGAANQANQQHDQQIAAIIAICNRHEVEAVKAALPKIKSDKVKELATAMIKDHTEGAEKFTRLAGPYGATIGAHHEGAEGRREEGRREGREEGRREERKEGDRGANRDNDQSDAKEATATRDNAATAPNNPTTRVAAAQNAPGAATQPAAQPGNQPRTALRPAMGGGIDWVAIHQEISNEGLANCKKEMSKYEGNEFDKAFLGSQLASHMKTATELKVFRRHVSNQLGSEIDNALSTVEDHLDHLRKLMDDKKDEGNK